MNRDVLLCVLSWYPFSLFKRIAPKFGIQPQEYEGRLFKVMAPSTLTVGGSFSDVKLHEEKDIHKFKAGGDIVLVGSLFGEDYLPSYAPKLPPPPNEQKKQRGRKPKTKEKKRKVKGNGRYFSSQITFVVRSKVKEGKLYKFKVFRTGVFQVPGVLNADMKDMDEPIETLRGYLMQWFPAITLQGRYVQMRNCKTILEDPDLIILTRPLGQLILMDQMKNGDQMKIFKVEYLTDKNASKTVVKFSRPTKSNPLKSTTLKILKQKINFEGGVGMSDINHIFGWLNNFLLDNYSKTIHDRSYIQAVDESDSESETDDEEPESVAQQIEITSDPYQLG